MQAQQRILKTLVEELETRRLRNPSYSLRAFARDLDLQPSGLSEILNGKRGVTRRLGQRLLAKLDVPGTEPLALIAELRGKNSKKQAKASPRPFSTLEHDTFKLISEWHYFAILSLAETRDFDRHAGDDPAALSKWVARRLGLKPRVAHQALERLERMGSLVRDRGRLRASGAQLATTNDIPDLAIRKSHFENLELARRALDQVPVEEREYGFITMAVDKARLPEAKQRIRAFRKELCELLEGSADKNEVYRLAVQLFPLTTRGPVLKTQEKLK